MNEILRRLSRRLPHPILTRLLYVYTCGPRAAIFRPALPQDERLGRLALSTGQNTPHRLLVDVSHQVYTQLNSGIPRVVNKVSAAMLALPQNDFSFEFVMTLNGQLTSARRFTERILALPKGSLGADQEITIREADHLLLLDNVWDKYPVYEPLFDRVHQVGGKTATVVNDLMPVQHPEWLPDDVVSVFLRALPQVILQNDILFCVSHSTAEDLQDWVRRHMPANAERLRTVVFSQGAEIGPSSGQATPLRESLARFLEQAQTEQAAVFSQVSIIQPRKGQDFALDAFESLWRENANFRLIYVGRKGWKAETLYRRIITHPEMGKRFLFVEEASESELAAVFDTSTALISPSRGARIAGIGE